MHTAFQRRKPGSGEMVSTSMKYGWTRDQRPSKSEWAGWGWRHVQAKHGWRADDIAATETALSLPPVEERSDGTLVYVGPEYTQNGAICERRVVLAPNRLPELNEPEPKEILTSYGRWDRDA